MQKIKKALTFFLAVLVAVCVAMPSAFARNEKASGGAGNSSNAKSEKVRDLKNYEKPSQSKTNATIHKEKINQVSTQLKQVAEEQKSKGLQNGAAGILRAAGEVERAGQGRAGSDEDAEEEGAEQEEQMREQEDEEVELKQELSEELEEIANEAEETEEETSEAIEKVENQGGFKKFLVGTDYKNLGQLRSSLVRNRNQIRKLTMISASTTDAETKEAIDQQLETLMMERERIKDVIVDGEEGFSILGWVFRFLNGYEKEPIGSEDEADLEEEVVQVISEETDESSGDENSLEEESQTGEIQDEQALDDEGVVSEEEQLLQGQE